MRKLLITLFVGMVAVAVGYTGANWLGALRVSPPIGPSIGDTLPATMVSGLPGGHTRKPLSSVLAADPASCVLLVMVMTDCPYCSRMRWTWPRKAAEWTRAVGETVSFVWLAGEPAAVLRSFYEGFDFSDVTLLNVTGNAGEALGRLGLFGTPTTYLLDAKRRLGYGVMGDRLPPIDVGRRICGPS